MNRFVYLILYLFISLSFSRKFKKILLFIGPSQNGKSCMINTWLGKEIAAEGKDDGESTTNTISAYTGILKGIGHNHEYLLIDTIGFGDSNGDGLQDYLISAKILLELKNGLEYMNEDLGGIIQIESLEGDSNKIRNVLDLIKFTLGSDAANHTLVLFTKYKKKYEKKLQRKGMICKELNINCLLWKGGCREYGNNYENQINTVDIILDRLGTYPRKKIFKRYDDLIKQGRKLSENKNFKKMVYKGIMSLGSSIAVSFLLNPTYGIYTGVTGLSYLTWEVYEMKMKSGDPLTLLHLALVEEAMTKMNKLN